MGNCLFGGGAGVIGGGGIGMGSEDDRDVIKVVNVNGGIMEFCSPITVEFITEEFPGHGIFQSHHDLFWKPLAHHQVLEAGEHYYLLPLDHHHRRHHTTSTTTVRHVRSNSCAPQIIHQSLLPILATPYRMSFDHTQYSATLKRSHTTAASADHHYQPFSRCSSNININGGGFWKVKLVINPQHLLEILSQESRTQQLIESVRTVAKCRIHGAYSNSLLFPDDQFSLSASSSTNARNPNIYSCH